MNEVKFLHDQIKTTFEGDTPWHGPSLLNTLEGVTVEEARAKPLGERHSIWELVDHITFWNEAAYKAVKEEKMPDLNKIEDWPSMGKTQSEWETSVEHLKKSVYLLLGVLVDWTNEDLEEQVPGADYNFRHLLHGLLHHNLYHTGQISLLRKKI